MPPKITKLNAYRDTKDFIIDSSSDESEEEKKIKTKKGKKSSEKSGTLLTKKTFLNLLSHLDLSAKTLEKIYNAKNDDGRRLFDPNNIEEIQEILYLIESYYSYGKNVGADEKTINKTVLAIFVGISDDKINLQNILDEIKNGNFNDLFKRVGDKYKSDIIFVKQLYDEYGYEKAFQLSNGIINHDDILPWSTQSSSIIKDQYEKILIRKYQPSEIDIDFGHICKNCKSKQFTLKMMQTRAADEPITIWITCNNCSERITLQ